MANNEEQGVDEIERGGRNSDEVVSTLSEDDRDDELGDSDSNEDADTNAETDTDQSES